jgi:AraC-like DNA-binding protein
MAISFVHLCQTEPSVVARRLLWHLYSVGRVWRDEPEIHPAFDKSGVFLFCVAKGSGFLSQSGQRWDLDVGPRCWLVDLRQSRTYEPSSGQRLETVGVRFSGPGLDAWLEVLGGVGEFRFSSSSDMLFLETAQQRLRRLVTRRPVGFEWSVHETMTHVLGRLLATRNVFATKPRTAPTAVSKVLDAVLSNPARAWRAAELASIAHVSYSGLRALFKATQHESLHQFLRRTRLDVAKQLLADERLSVKEIAWRLNFSSEAYFSQWFRRNTGHSPSAFRTSGHDSYE